MTSANALVSALSLGTLLAIAACGGKHDDAVEELESLAEEICACEDTACVGEVEKKVEAFMKENAELKGDDVPEETVEKLQAAGKKAAACMQKLEE